MKQDHDAEQRAVEALRKAGFKPNLAPELEGGGYVRVHPFKQDWVTILPQRGEAVIGMLVPLNRVPVILEAAKPGMIAVPFDALDKLAAECADPDASTEDRLDAVGPFPELLGWPPLEEGDENL